MQFMLYPNLSATMLRSNNAGGKEIVQPERSRRDSETEASDVATRDQGWHVTRPKGRLGMGGNV